MSTPREVTAVVTAHEQLEGGGFLVRRPFPTRGLEGVDPLLMLDELGPVTYAPGEARIGGRSIERGQLAVLGEGEALPIETPVSGPGLQALVLGGVPIGEPVAWQGPFVMNTRAELIEAITDYQEGRMGSIPPEIVRA